MFHVDQLSAFIGGLLTFLAPCTLPLIPAYLAFIGGVRPGDESTSYRKTIFLNALGFVIGFSLVFMIFGMVSGAVGATLILYRKVIAQVGGVIVVLLGLSMLGVFHFPFMGNLPTKLPIFSKEAGFARAFALGFLFAIGWSPCLGPVLGTILVLATSHADVLYGGWLLLIYATGLALPFLVLAALYGHAVLYVGKLQTLLPIIGRIGALLIIGIGLLLVFGQFGSLNAYGLDIFAWFGIENLLDKM
jgi:cytochrome c-type biogenesis protein